LILDWFFVLDVFIGNPRQVWVKIVNKAQQLCYSVLMLRLLTRFKWLYDVTLLLQYLTGHRT
jgi:hypothetical protein